MNAFAGEFHARSAFSFLRGSSKPEEMVIQAAALGHQVIAVTDHRGFYGSVRAHKTAENFGIKAVVGTTLELPIGHVPVLCSTQAGYQKLSRHLTDLHCDPPEADGFRSETGLIVLTGDREGPLCKPLLRNDKLAALAAAESLIQLFGRENIYVELNRHGLRDDPLLNRQLIDRAKHLRLQ